MDPSAVNNFRKPLAVLLVEDTQVDQRMLESMLSGSPDATSFFKIADSLDSSLKILNEHVFDVILLDLNLPDSKGIATIERITEEHPEIAIVVNTGAYEDDLGIQTLGYGAQDFLVKGKYTIYTLNKVLHYAVERKRLEQDLKEAYAKLKSTQSQLIQAEKLKVVGSLASGVAHEVRNPLATILYGVTYLQDNTKVGNDKNLNIVLENLKEASDRANNIISDLLDFASLNRMVKKEENISDLIDKTLSLINHQIEKKAIVLKREIQDALPKLMVDRNRIEQVLINVLLNAVNASSDGGEIQIIVKSVSLKVLEKENKDFNLSKFDGNKNIVCVQILDSGKGIDDGLSEKLFDPFYTTNRELGGVGLGLSVCKNIMENHEAEISICNRKQQGAVVTLLFQN